MKELLIKYFKMSDEEKEKLKDLYLIHEIEKRAEDYDFMEEEAIFYRVKSILEMSNINIEELVTRIFEILDGADIDIEDIIEADNEEIIDLISDCYNDFQENSNEIIRDYQFDDLSCMFIKAGTKYIVVMESKVDNNKPKVLIYNSLGELLDDLIKYREEKEDNDIE